MGSISELTTPCASAVVHLLGPPTIFAYRLTQLTFLFALGYRSDKQEPEQIMNSESIVRARSVFLDERFVPTLTEVRS